MAKEIKIGTVAITCGSRVPLLNDGVLVVVVDLGHRMDRHRYVVRRVDGQPLPMVGVRLYRSMVGRISAERLIPVEDPAPDSIPVAHRFPERLA